MLRKAILPGILGAVVMILWLIVVNGLFGFKSNIDMKTVPDEEQVHAMLSAKITEPGRYVCNPVAGPEGFPPEGPVFGILYGGVGHEAAGRLMLLQLPVLFIASMLAAWLLLHASHAVLASYPRKLAFFLGLGFLLAGFRRLSEFGIGDYPAGDALALALHDLLLWFSVGLVMAWRIKPPARR